ncbi:MAG: DUF2384 domain-containing protein [Verrucomicrobiae bacterium]|nr:DUF2384 domain-containing protein [Verrucomicrobiae bacterium]
MSDVIVPYTVASKPGQRTGGVVRQFMQDFGDPGAAVAFEPARLVGALRAGLSIGELEDLQSSLQIPMERLAPILGISKATLHRRKATGRLDPAESDRVVRFARLMGQAVRVLESEASARQWLSSPQHGLGGAIPLEFAETEVGAREVEQLLGRIEHGVYS